MCTYNAAATLAALTLAAAAHAQATQTALFVSNDGNNEGSVTTYTLDALGLPVFSSITLTSDGPDEQGNNAENISVSPDGSLLLVGHAAGGTSPNRQLTLLRVNPDASTTVIGEFLVPATPLGTVWITDDIFAVVRSNISGPTNAVDTYRLTLTPTPMITFVDSAPTGSFTTAIAKHPTEPVIYTQTSLGSDAVITLRVSGTGALTEIDRDFTGSTFPLGVVVGADARFVYAFGGISSGGSAILAYRIEPDFRLTPVTGSPFASPGASPKGGATNDDGSLLFVTHGTDATIRSFTVDNETGALTPTGSSFDVGLQGSLQDIAVVGSIIYAVDETTALDGLQGCLALEFDAAGTLTPLNTPVPSQGIAPTGIAAWVPSPALPCPTDLDGSGTTDLADLLQLLASFGIDDGGNVDGDGDTDLNDLLAVLAEFGNTCP